jgi:hypothetical protein
MNYVKAIYNRDCWCIWKCESWKHKMKMVYCNIPQMHPKTAAPFHIWAHENFDEGELTILTEDEAFLEMI